MHLMLSRPLPTMFIWAALLISGGAWAYPQFISYGYHSCLICHYNPFGNGPLTDYGRALGASTIAGRAFRDTQTSDEELGQKSGFLWHEPMNSWFRPTLDYRGLYLKRNYGATNEESEFIHMMASTNLVLKSSGGTAEFPIKDRWIAVFNFGYAPDPIAQTPGAKEQGNWRSREHYVGGRLTQRLGVYMGLMDKVFGVRVPDHVAFSRTLTGLAQNDQSHGIMGHYGHEKFDLGLHWFVGNMDQDELLRQRGYSGMFDWSMTQDTRLGASLLSSKHEYLQNDMMAVHTKSAFGKGHSIMAEVGQVKKTTILTSKDVVSRYVFLQNHILLHRGMFLLTTVEQMVPNADKENKVLRLGPGFQFFPLQGFEFRADLYNSRSFSETSAAGDRWDVTGQVHLWF